jgi:2-dehydropantoate 2-reductase
MRVAVIGTGGVGGLYGGVLARAGHEVGFLARGAHLAAIREHGLQVRSTQFGTFSVHGLASDNAKELGQADLALFAVKTYDLAQAADSLRSVLGEGSMVLTFQNGLEAPDRVAEIVGAEHVLIGTSALETYVAEPGVVAHTSAFHMVTVSELNGPPTPRLQQVYTALKEAGVNVQIVDDGRRALWQKAFNLIPMATATSLCETSIGPIRDLPETAALLESLLQELQGVAAACGYELPEGATTARGFITNAHPGFTSSMARDFERGRRTELDALTGAVVRLGQARGVDVPATRTAYAVLKLRETRLGNASQRG